MSGHSTWRSLRRSIFRRPDDRRKRLAVEPLEDRRMLAVAAMDDFPGGVVAEAAAAPAGFDFGDAPSPYPTTLADDGARHEAIGPTLGSLRDEELDGQPTAGGDGADEDGVTFGSIRVGQLDAMVTVNVQSAPTGAKLDAWIDFNGDGNWGGPGERIFASQSVNNGDTALRFDVPSWAISGSTYARFRLSTLGDLAVGGSAADGEVEDYEVTIIPPAPAPGVFGGPNIIATVSAPMSVFAADLDGDGDVDVLSASHNESKIAWYENDGSGGFTAHTISTDAQHARSVFAVDLDGDGDIDVLSASLLDDKIAWYENDGNEGFTAHTISTDADQATSVFAADVDGDGDIDVLSASNVDNKIAWYENDGNEGFTAHTISTDARFATSVFAADVDGDGDIDVLSASSGDNKIAWYENDGREGFTSHTISTAARGARSVFAADVDGDGDIDVLSASRRDDKIAWYENDGSEGFTAHTISTAARGASTVFAADMDGDGDTDILSASWYENDGSESFTADTVSVAPDFTNSVFAADIDGDGDLDVLRASGNMIAWYENVGLDYGDAPAPYPTLSSDDGPFHVAIGPTIGTLRDAEIDGQPTDRADGDGSGEDGVKFGPMIVGRVDARVTVDVRNAPAGALLDAWIDFDGDGNWSSLTDHVVEGHIVHDGINTILFGVPLTAQVGMTFARFRLRTTGDLSPTGPAADGEVEDYLINVLPAQPWDFGDAPAPYPTRLSDQGAFHEAVGPTLGAVRDVENDGQPSAAADGDGEDDDAVTFSAIRVGQLGAAVTVNVRNAPSGARVDAWIDFNRDGTWGGPGEQIFDGVSVDNGDNALLFDVPSWAVDGSTFARVRLSTAGDLGIGGYAADGEVEDYLITINPPVAARGLFVGQNVISTTADRARSVFAVDLDGDGDMDVLSASEGDDRIAWYENDGSERFTAHDVNTPAPKFSFFEDGNADNARSVFAADLDGDGDMDVLSASSHDDRIAWYENDGSQNFTQHNVNTPDPDYMFNDIDGNADGANSVFAADVDGDGDIDVLSASANDDRIAWYENDGSGHFVAHTISTAADGAASVFAADVDGDGDIDVLSASFLDNKIAWYENDGLGGFIAHTISTAADWANSVFAADVDRDGDMDVLSASSADDKIAWYENDGSQNFTEHVVNSPDPDGIPNNCTNGDANVPRSVFAADLDGDGDIDVLSAS
ncbi:MAG: VCBS repeat-containing protein, partial [Planctomycetes bacterium]|nr:VCBS repeat-containing protein [Planctomycetota bacterium]